MSTPHPTQIHIAQTLARQRTHDIAQHTNYLALRIHLSSLFIRDFSKQYFLDCRNGGHSTPTRLASVQKGKPAGLFLQNFPPFWPFMLGSFHRVRKFVVKIWKIRRFCLELRPFHASDFGLFTRQNKYFSAVK